MPPFDNDSPTKRHSGTLQRGPIWEGLARLLAEHLREVEAKRRAELDRMAPPQSGFGEATRSLVSARLQARMAEARALAQESTAISREFKSWESADPGTEARDATLVKWRDLERRAKEFEARED